MKAEVTNAARSEKSARQLPAYSRRLPTATSLELRNPSPRHPSRMQSPVETELREVGLTLHEILAVADIMREAYGNGDMESLRHRLILLMSKATALESALSHVTAQPTRVPERENIACKRLDIVTLLNGVSEAARKIAVGKPVTVMDVSCPGPVFISSDPAPIERIMSGLMSNATKFTDRGRIAVILSRDDNAITLTVADTGRGMTPEQIREALGPSGYDAAVNGIAASGRGLRTIKALVKKLGGSISISSKLGEGTIAEVSLPMELLE